MKRIPTSAIEQLRDNRRRILERIARAAEQSGRRPDQVRLVAVTKSVTPEVTAALVELGQQDLGENRPESLVTKRELMGNPAGVQWHMIGHFQRRKIREAAPVLDFVHGVDRGSLLEGLNRRLAELGRCVPVLLQVNISGELAKQGFFPDAVPEALRLGDALVHVPIQGLMTMAPEGATEPELHRIFAELRELRNRCATEKRPLPELSMGMSQDFEAAIREGATMVRVGSALFHDL